MLDVLEAPPPENLLESWPDIGQIPREAGLSKQDFERNYLDRHLPVILENKVAGWRALKEWTPEALANDYGDIQVHASLNIPDRSDVEFSYWGSTAEWIPLRQFTEFMATSDRPCYIRQIPSDRFPNFEDFFDLNDFLDMADRKPAVGLWFGSARTDSGLHWDTESNFFTQIYGRKHVILCPPGDMKHLYPYRDQIRWTAFDAFAPNFDRFPRGRNARPIFASMRPGDTLFIPTGW